MRSLKFGREWLALILLCCITQCQEETAPVPGQLLVVVNKANHSATVIDPLTGEVKAVLATGVAPHEVAVDGGSGLAVVTNYGTRQNPGSSLTVLDIRQLRSKRTIDLDRFRRPHGIQFFKNGKRVAVTVEDSQALLVVNIEDGKIEKVIPTTQKLSHMVVLSPDETRAFTSNIQSGSISVLDLEKGSFHSLLESGDGAEGLDVSPDGSELWVANRAEDTISVFDAESLQIVEKLECGSFPIRVRFLPDGQIVLVSNARSGDVAVFSTDGSRHEVARVPMELTALEREDRLFDFDLSPVPIGIVTDLDGKRAFIANSNANIVSVIDLTDLQVVARLRSGEQPDGMGFLILKPVQPFSSTTSDGPGMREGS